MCSSEVFWIMLLLGTVSLHAMPCVHDVGGDFALYLILKDATLKIACVWTWYLQIICAATTRERLFKALLLEQMTVHKTHLNSYRNSSDFGKIYLPYFSARVRVCWKSAKPWVMHNNLRYFWQMDLDIHL